MSAVPDSQTFALGALRRRALATLALVLLGGLLLSAIWFGYSSAREAREQTLDAGGRQMRQAAALLQPLLLADDRVSLNYLINELGDRPDIRGIELYNQAGELVARSGENDGPLERELTLERDQQDQGRLLFWFDPAPARHARLMQLTEAGILWLLTALVALIGVWRALRPRPAALAEPVPEPLPDEAEAEYDDVGVQEASLEDDAPQTLENAPPEPEPAPAPEKPEASFDGLLDLLKPVKDRLMPRFEPSQPQLHEESTRIDEAIEIDDDLEVEPERPAPRANPLRGRDEEQLGLYSFEQELELLLPPRDALYLFLIDTASGHAEYVDEEERQALLDQYLQYAHQIGEIYSGEVEPKPNGDIRLWFLGPTDEDRHGANALCAAKLFTLLYRAFNENRIRNFQPVLNLHMSLVRGNRDKPERMLEEAHYLTRSTQSNELISHTALTETPDIKSSLLEAADIRREDEDKVLVLSLSEAYEELLQKQAGHLLNKP